MPVGRRDPDLARDLAVLEEGHAAPGRGGVEGEHPHRPKLNAGPGEDVYSRVFPRPRPTMSTAAIPQTPAMQQYVRMKAEHPGALLFFRMGDFYELFFEDAEIASRALEIALTSRGKDRDGRAHPHVRRPPPRGPGYIARLVKQGHRVALCEQMEDPRTAKGVVKREVVRVITPGTQLEARPSRRPRPPS